MNRSRPYSTARNLETNQVVRSSNNSTPRVVDTKSSSTTTLTYQPNDDDATFITSRQFETRANHFPLLRRRLLDSAVIRRRSLITPTNPTTVLLSASGTSFVAASAFL